MCQMRHQTHTSILNPDDLHTYIHVMRYILYRVNSFLLYHSRHASVRVLMVITFKAPPRCNWRASCACEYYIWCSWRAPRGDIVVADKGGGEQSSADSLKSKAWHSWPTINTWNYVPMIAGKWCTILNKENKFHDSRPKMWDVRV